VATARATVIDTASVSAESQARAWLDRLDPASEAQAATVMLNRVLLAQRIATADPYVHEVSPAQALVVRAGWGEGEEVAYGRWLHARELHRGKPRVRRSAALRPQERLAVLLAAREAPLLCEELVLRARLDLDESRLPHAALQLERAYAAALAELPREPRVDPGRIAELTELQAGVQRAAQAALTQAAGTVAARVATRPAGLEHGETPEALDEEPILHALRRLEAALRARTAAGVGAPGAGS
jgi:hypothetical protein